MIYRSSSKNDVNAKILEFVYNLSLNKSIPKDILFIIHSYYLIINSYLISFYVFPEIVDIFNKTKFKL